MTPAAERERNDALREKVRERLSRSLMRTPDPTDQLHLGLLLEEVWQEGYQAGWNDWPSEETVNPFS